VFADLGFANPQEELLKARLVREIRATVERRKLTQAKAAALMGVKDSHNNNCFTSLVRLARQETT
jgi:predicted XRE-type DNA-binding protein